MQPKVYITNGGPHTAATWAEITLPDIVEIPPNSSNPDLARKTELKFLDILEEFHTHIQAAERAGLDEDGDGRLESPIDGLEHDPEEVITQMAAVVVGTPWQGHFDREDVKEHVRNVLLRHAVLNADVERGWWSDANATSSPAAVAWKKTRTERGILAAHTFNEEAN